MVIVRRFFGIKNRNCNPVEMKKATRVRAAFLQIGF